MTRFRPILLFLSVPAALLATATARAVEWLDPGDVQLRSDLATAVDPWAAPGDVRLRHDLQLLADAGIVHAPLTSWPVSWAEVARDLASVPEDASLPAHVGTALAPDYRTDVGIALHE